MSTPPEGGAGRTRLAAALYNGDVLRLADEVARIESSGLDALHVDVFDGRLVPDLAFAPRVVGALRECTSLALEVHLVAELPERFAPELAQAGADLVLLQAEGAPMLYETLFAFREQNLRVGVALGLAAPLVVLEPVLGLCDAVLLLSRVTGEGTRGATFDPLVLPRVREVAGLIRAGKHAVELHVAGGVNRSNAAELSGAGAGALALGAGLYRVPDMAAEAAEIRRLTDGAPA